MKGNCTFSLENVSKYSSQGVRLDSITSIPLQPAPQQYMLLTKCYGYSRRKNYYFKMYTMPQSRKYHWIDELNWPLIAWILCYSWYHLRRRDSQWSSSRSQSKRWTAIKIQTFWQKSESFPLIFTVLQHRTTVPKEKEPRKERQRNHWKCRFSH